MNPLYGPYPDPKQILFTPNTPGPWIVTLLLGLLLVAWSLRPLSSSQQVPTKTVAEALSNSVDTPLSKRLNSFIFICGAVITLTAPMFFYIPSLVIGSFPTIDKAGSLAFYEDGVMWRLFDPNDPGMRLIGVHLGHLWVTAFFDLLLSPIGAFNAQGFLNLILGWYCASRLFRALGAQPEAALAAAFPFGMGLHLFRDLNWYTIEKSAVFWLPLYALCLWYAFQRGGRWIMLSALVFGLAFFMNAYWSLVCGAMVAWALLLSLLCPQPKIHAKQLTFALLASLLAGAPLLFLQSRLLVGDGALGSPEAFAERAQLDVFSLWPLAWNRMEAWAALEPLLCLLAVWKFRKNKQYWIFALPFFVLSLGPSHNPLYFLCNLLIPGFWRVAKPEVFFEVSWLMILGAASQSLSDWLRNHPGWKWRAGLATVLALSWLLRVRLHPVYPPLSKPAPVSLAPELKPNPQAR